MSDIEFLNELFEKYKDKYCDHRVMPSLSKEASIAMALEYNAWKQAQLTEGNDSCIVHISTPNIQNPFLAYVKGASDQYIYVGQASSLSEAQEIIDETL